MTRPTTTAAILAATAVAAIAAIAITGARHEQKTSTAAPRIYGAGQPAAETTPAPKATPTASDVEDIARRWTTAFDRAGACPDAAADRRTIVELAAGELATQLAQQPPRPSYDADCHPKRIVRVTAAGPPDSGGIWKVFVQHKGATGGPLTLTLQPTTNGLRVAALDY